MQLRAVQALCHRLTPFQLRAIQDKGQPGSEEISVGVALLYWAVDFVSGLQLLDQDRIRLWVDAFSEHIIRVGDTFGEAFKLSNDPYLLPPIKMGFLDRSLAVIDGCASFLNLETGEQTVAQYKLRPREIYQYDLGIIFAEYYQRLCADSIPALLGARE